MLSEAYFHHRLQYCEGCFAYNMADAGTRVRQSSSQCSAFPDIQKSRLDWRSFWAHLESPSIGRPAVSLDFLTIHPPAQKTHTQWGWLISSEIVICDIGSGQVAYITGKLKWGRTMHCLRNILCSSVDHQTARVAFLYVEEPGWSAEEKSLLKLSIYHDGRLSTHTIPTTFQGEVKDMLFLARSRYFGTKLTLHF